MLVVVRNEGASAGHAFRYSQRKDWTDIMTLYIALGFVLLGAGQLLAWSNKRGETFFALGLMLTAVGAVALLVGLACSLETR